jgi:Transcriptional regulator PadR-like family
MMQSRTRKRIRSKIARGSAGLAILSLLAKQSLYGFEISRGVEEQSGALKFNLPSLYPMLYELDKHGWFNITGRRTARVAIAASIVSPQRAESSSPPLPREWPFFSAARPSGGGVACLTGAPSSRNGSFPCGSSRGGAVFVHGCWGVSLFWRVDCPLH